MKMASTSKCLTMHKYISLYLFIAYKNQQVFKCLQTDSPNSQAGNLSNTFLKNIIFSGCFARAAYFTVGDLEMADVGRFFGVESFGSFRGLSGARPSFLNSWRLE